MDSTIDKPEARGTTHLWAHAVLQPLIPFAGRNQVEPKGGGRFAVLETFLSHIEVTER